jgi:hypothetical protein
MKSSQAVLAHHGARQPAPQPRPHRRATAPVAPEVREVMIAEAAYYLSEHRGFEPGAELDDWLAAESEIDRLLAGSATVEEVDELDEMAEIAERLAR